MGIWWKIDKRRSTARPPPVPPHLPETYLSRPYLCPLSQDDPVYCYSTVRLALSCSLITILDMSLRRTLPQSEFLNPLRSGAPPIEFDWEGRSGSVLSSTTAFNRVLDHRDTILGLPACIICGDPNDVKRCHIIPEEENASQKSFSPP